MLVGFCERSRLVDPSRSVRTKMARYQKLQNTIILGGTFTLSSLVWRDAEVRRKLHLRLLRLYPARRARSGEDDHTAARGDRGPTARSSPSTDPWRSRGPLQPLRPPDPAGSPRMPLLIRASLLPPVGS